MRFTRHSAKGQDQAEIAIHTLIVAGWTGRDHAALMHHVHELEAIGVPAPSAMPVFYRNAATNLTQETRVEFLGPDTSGEVEPVIVAFDDGLYLGVGSDHTDRKAETIGIALSKQLCAKPVGTTLWRFDEIADDWDQMTLRSFATIGGKRTPYQDGSMAAMRHPSDLIARYGSDLKPGTLMFCGTLGAIGGIRPADRFEMELEDVKRSRTLKHAYDAVALPVVS